MSFANNFTELVALSTNNWQTIEEYRKQLATEPEIVNELLKYGPTVFINPNPRSNSRAFESLSAHEEEEDARYRRLEFVPWHCVRLIQPTVYTQGVDTYSAALQRGELIVPPLAQIHKGKTVITGGTHRTIALSNFVRWYHPHVNANSKGIYVAISDNYLNISSAFTISEVQFQ